MEQKTINVHPDLLFLSKGKTQKNRKKSATSDSAIKVKNKPKPRNETLRKQSLLRMIRKHQDERHRQQMSLVHTQSKTNNISNGSSFEETKQFMENLQKKHKVTEPNISISGNQNNHYNQQIKNNNDMSYYNQGGEQVNNKTLKQHHYNDIQIIDNDLEQPVMEKTNPITNEPISMHFHMPDLSMKPKYGCLKNGNLPTYRNYNTSKNFHNLQHSNNSQSNITQSNNVTSNVGYNSEYANKLKTHKQMTELEALRNYNDMRKQQETHEKQKKIIRRTFNVGKQKVGKKISVLISNKKIRSNITMKVQQIKNVDIQDIKKDLLKRGLIKVGCITPESVLRKMYEVVHTLCGSLYNHNPDNLLHNYLNGGIHV